MKLSIIIPVYNTSAYVQRCITSALDQDIDAQSYEIIVVDDGSPDNSAELVQRIAALNSNVKLYRKQNEGVSIARNYGTDLARGEYVMYVDSDDYLEPRVLGSLIEKMDDLGCDMLLYDIRFVDESGHALSSDFHEIAARAAQAASKARNKVCNENPMCNTFSGVDVLRGSIYPMSMCTYLFGRDFIARHNFRQKPFRHEDVEIIPQMLYRAKKVGIYSLIAYNYFRRSDSFTAEYSALEFSHMLLALSSLNAFASSIDIENPQAARYIRQKIASIGTQYYGKLAKSDRYSLESSISEGRSMGVLPMVNNPFRLRRLLLNRFPTLYKLFYKLRG